MSTETSKDILKSKAEALLKFHASRFASYETAYYTNVSYLQTNNSEFAHSMDFTVVIVSDGTCYRCREKVLYDSYAESHAHTLSE